jgi:hypothetical protein
VFAKTDDQAVLLAVQRFPSPSDHFELPFCAAISSLA